MVPEFDELSGGLIGPGFQGLFGGCVLKVRGPGRGAFPEWFVATVV